jgi:hypothetical protein
MLLLRRRPLRDAVTFCALEKKRQPKGGDRNNDQFATDSIPYMQKLVVNVRNVFFKGKLEN